jgi:predicted secreted protein
MTPFNDGVAFIVIFMAVFFCVLPFGVKTHDEAGEEMLPGQATSAPVNPRLGLKALISLGIATVLFGIYFVIGYYDLLGLSDLFGRS